MKMQHKYLFRMCEFSSNWDRVIYIGPHIKNVCLQLVYVIRTGQMRRCAAS